jgi:hypothetical protein
LYRYGLKNGGTHRIRSYRYGSSHRIGAGVDHRDRIRTGVGDISLRAIGVITTSAGINPTARVVTTVLVAVLITVTLLAPALAT